MSSPPRLAPGQLRQRLEGQVVLAPLTRGGNLPFRRLCVEMGATVTVSEMVQSRRLVGRRGAEASLLRRHPSEPTFGVQLSARAPEVGVAAALLAAGNGADFVDLNLGCPIDSVVRRGEGAALLEKPRRLERLLRAMRAALEIPLTVKIRSGYRDGRENAVEIARLAEDCGVDAITVHGRTRQQRYRRPADWDLVARVAAAVSIPVVGNGDVLHAGQARHRLASSGCAAVMAARGALIKPWLWSDLAAGEDRAWTAPQRLAVMRRWVEMAVEHWGDDEHGFVRIRQFLEFHVDFWRRYVPPDADRSGDDTLQGRASFEPRDELEAILRAPDDAGIARACDLILEPFDPPAAALRPSTAARDPTAGGWS